MRGIEEAGFTECTPVQEMTFQKTLAGKDVMVQSQTGTGKTAAFLITIFNLFLSDEKYRNKKALVLTPTRELALQVAEAFHSYGRLLDGFMVLPLYGGQSFGTQIRQLQREQDKLKGESQSEDGQLAQWKQKKRDCEKGMAWALGFLLEKPVVTVDE